MLRSPVTEPEPSSIPSPKARRGFQKSRPGHSRARADYPADRHVWPDCRAAWFRQPCSAARLTPENQAQNKPDPKGRKNRLRWILADVLLGVVLKRSNAGPRIAPSLLGFAPGVIPSLLGLATVFPRDRASRVSQILRRFPRVGFAALEFVLCVRHRGLAVCFILFSHWYSPVEFRCKYPRASDFQQTPG